MPRLKALGERRSLRANQPLSRVLGVASIVDVNAIAFRTTKAVVNTLGGAVWRLLLLYRVDERAEDAARLRA